MQSEDLFIPEGQTNDLNFTDPVKQIVSQAFYLLKKPKEANS